MFWIAIQIDCTLSTAMQLHDISPLLSLPARGGPETLVLCSTPRLAQALKRHHDEAQRAAGLHSWPTLRTHTFEQWLADCRADWLLTEHALPMPVGGRLLSPIQERLIWERLIRQHTQDLPGHALLDLKALAVTAQEAYALQSVWGVAHTPNSPVEEHRQFGIWRDELQHWCDEQACYPRHVLDRATVAHLSPSHRPEPWPQTVVLAGFNRLNPVEADALSALQRLGVALQRLDHPANGTCEVRAYPDATSEIYAAAHWAKAWLQRRPDARLGLVVPDLAGSLALVTDTLESVLAPALIRPAHAESARPFNISLGRPLSQFPLVSAALLLIEMALPDESLDVAALDALWRHPYWTPPDTAVARATVQPMLTRQLGRQFDWSAVAMRLNDPRFARHTEALAPVRQAVAALAERAPASALPSAWSPWLLEALPRWGWLQGRRLSSHEYQTQQAFEEGLHELGQWDALLGPIGLRDAAARLRDLCDERIFQPQTEGKPALEVMGLLEACGPRFDALWVMGMTTTHWPPAAKPNPLLTAAAQRRAGSPNASADLQYAFAHAVQGQLVRAAPEVVLSWPQAHGATLFQPSSLLHDWAMAPHTAATPAHWIEEALCGQHTWLMPPEPDEKAPAVSDSESLRGGTGLLRAQAICPAWAYFRYRLGAAPLEELGDMLDSRERGSLVHRALEALWRRLGNQATLLRLSEADRADVISAAVTQALEQHDQAPSTDPLPDATRALEAKRLIRLLTPWLQLECERTHGFTVVATEQAQHVSIGGLALQVQIDRVDQLDDGHLLIMDYKTGAVPSTESWGQDRITEPQLPLYAACVAHETGPVAGLLFAHIDLKDPGWSGVLATDLGSPKALVWNSARGRKQYAAERWEGWHDLLHHWRLALEATVQGLREGDARVRCDDERALAYCDVRPLLRLSERRQQWEQL